MDALLLDFNGVVVNDEPLHMAAFRDILQSLGIPLDEKTYYAEYLGVDDRAAFRKALGGRREAQVVPELVANKAKRYGELAARHLPLVPGVTAFVRAAAKSMKVAVVSGALRAEIDQGLRLAGLDGVVATVVAQEDLPTTKPDPAGLRLALKRLAPTRAVVIEDSPPGLAAARAIGLKCLMLATTLPKVALAGADRTWDTFEGHVPEELLPLMSAVEPEQ